ncbi:YMGG-like glycine zipper-containing protein [Nitrococcus mobilis]|uniref:YMGG-like Gly-zipper domain-containing protein n=1 Tax=Nitrococcus mobilis Nb-231 TaxID=314278 RepID=A4BUT7_9GAMM|nr:glycine zipper family protein [Nitrococcus mobilis]EAR20541.1 hypothetical protein NB231_01783 [Nitrococcus mobilis Nb-231]
MKLRILMHAIVVGAALWVAHSAVAQSPIIYPSKGQSAEQKNKDTAECKGWAQQNTGVDPVALAEAQAQAAPNSGAARHEGIRGAARGAGAGAIIGAIAGDAGKGAAIGAASGGLAGGARQHRAQRRAEETAEAQQGQTLQALARYRKAFAACMEGRDYVIK